MVLSDNEIKARILHKMARKRIWGGKHTSIKNISKGFKSRHLGKKGIKKIKLMVEELIRQNLILAKPTHYGLEISLNPREKPRIMRIVEKHLKSE